MDKILQKLQKYSKKGHFSFKLKDNLLDVCNAPVDKSGVYLFCKKTEPAEIIYIGCSGHITGNGNIHVRQTACGGIKSRIVFGHQFGRKRMESLHDKMVEDNIKELEIH